MHDGLVVVDKPAGWTSHDVVARMRRAYGQRRVGHAGTLDPDATGVLLVGLGRATRLLRFLQETTKAYRGRIVFGIATTTLDASGAVLDQQPDDAHARRDRTGHARLPRRHRAAAADGVGGAGRWSPPARARARRQGSRTGAAPRARRPLRHRGVRAGRVSRRPPRWSSAAAAPTSGRSPPTSAPRSAAARTSRRCAACASDRSGSTRRTRSTTCSRTPSPRCCRPAEAMRDLEPVVLDEEQARAVAHGMAFHCTAFSERDGEPSRGAGCGAVRDDRRERRPARGLRAPRRRGEAGGGARVRIVHELSELAAVSPAGSVVTIGVYDGVHLGHRAVLRLVRDLAVARRDGCRVRHVRSPPGRGRAPAVGAAAPHRHRAEARAPRRVGLPRHVLRPALRRGAQPGVGGGLRSRGAGRRRAGAPRGRRRRLPLRARPGRQRADARADGRRARVRGDRRRPRGRGRRHDLLVHRDPRAPRRAATSPARRSSSAAPTSCGGR